MVLWSTFSFYLAIHTYFSDSEIWAVSVARHFGSNENISIYTKIPFYAILKTLYAIPLSNITHLEAARFIFFAIGIANVLVFYRLCQSIFKSRELALGLTILLQTTTFFLSQSFRIRSDNLSCLLFLLFLLVAFSKTKSNRTLAILSACLFAATPKAVYFLFAAVVAIYFVTTGSRWERFRRAMMVCLLPPLVFLCIGFIGSNFISRYPMAQAYGTAALFFKSGFSDQLTPYFSRSDFFFLMRFVHENPLHSILLVLGFFSSVRLLWRPQNASRFFKAIAAVTVGLFVCLIFHNEKLPFYIASLLPSLLLSVGVLFQRANLKTSRIGAICLIAFATFFPFSLKLAQLDGNSEQKAAILYLQNYIHANKVNSYYDAIGILPRQNHIYLFPGPSDARNPRILDEIEILQPALILYTAKLHLLEPDLSIFLHHHYVHLGHGLWARGLNLCDLPALSNEKTSFKLATLWTELDKAFPGGYPQYFLYQRLFNIPTTPKTISIFYRHRRWRWNYLFSAPQDAAERKDLEQAIAKFEASDLQNYAFSPLPIAQSFPGTLNLANDFAFDFNF